MFLPAFPLDLPYFAEQGPYFPKVRKTKLTCVVATFNTCRLLMTLVVF